MATMRLVARQNADEAVAGKPKRRGGVSGARRKIVSAMPEIAELMIEKTMEGSVPHLKLALELAGVDKRSAKGAGARAGYSGVIERQLLQELDAKFPSADVPARGEQA